jgi:hypothetical protein
MRDRLISILAALLAAATLSACAHREHDAGSNAEAAAEAEAEAKAEAQHQEMSSRCSELRASFEEDAFAIVQIQGPYSCGFFAFDEKRSAPFGGPPGWIYRVRNVGVDARRGQLDQRWADSGRCPAVRDAIVALSKLPAPAMKVRSLHPKEDSEIIRLDGSNYTFWTDIAGENSEDDLEYTVWETSDLADWVGDWGPRLFECLERS